MAIEARHINKAFGTTPVLQDVSVEVASGSLTALLGPSGGGKSTLLRVIAGLEQPDSGTVLISSNDVTRLSPQRRNVGFVFQHYAAFKHMTVFDNVAFGLQIRKRPKDQIRTRVHELLELVHLDQFAKRYPAQLSGGQRQRMALARALAVEPEVLLLDEPFGALDAQVRKELRTWLRRLHDEVHVTTVFVTHDQEEAIEVADTIVVLAGGEVVQAGSPHDLYDHPATPFVMSFLGPVTQVNGHLVRPHDVEISTAPSKDSVPATVTRIVRLGFEVRAELAVTARSELASPAAGTNGDSAGEQEAWAQLTRGTADSLGLRAGTPVHIRVLAD